MQSWIHLDVEIVVGHLTAILIVGCRCVRRREDAALGALLVGCTTATTWTLVHICSLTFESETVIIRLS